MDILKYIRLFTATCVFVVLGYIGTVPAVTNAATPHYNSNSSSSPTAQQTVCSTLGAGANCSNTSPNGSLSINQVIKVIVNIFSFVVGVVAVIMIMVGGFQYVTSGGDSSKTSSAKNVIVYAIVGLLIVGFAQTIVWFVLNHLG